MLRFIELFRTFPRMAQAPKRPLIAIIGATGTGKSDVRSHNQDPATHQDTDHGRQLAVEIALKYDGEIINGDAMQLYQGLPVITNKITQEEMKGVPHHLLGCIGLEEETFTAGKFVKRALKTVWTNGPLPKVGTNACRLTKFAVEANSQSWSAERTSTPSHFYSEKRCQMNAPCTLM
jgi:hypothetical protein